MKFFEGPRELINSLFFSGGNIFARKGKAFIYRYTIHEHDRDASCADSTPEALRQRETVVLHEPSV